MTGKYSDFKGKLKVGDRVRHNHQSWNAEAEVLEVDEEWFRTTEGCFLWTWDTGTLELLSPPPRVVTLETLEPGDELSCQLGATTLHRRVIDIGKRTGVAVVRWIYGSEEDAPDIALTVKELRSQGFKPVQPVSTPAPAMGGEFRNVTFHEGPMSREQFEKLAKEWLEHAPAEKKEEWWYDKHLIGLYGAMFECGDYEGLIEKIRLIVSEAKRRGAEEAWKELSELIADKDNMNSPGFTDSYKDSWQSLGSVVRQKLESINNPAGAGEK